MFEINFYNCIKKHMLCYIAILLNLQIVNPEIGSFIDRYRKKNYNIGKFLNFYII